MTKHDMSGHCNAQIHVDGYTRDGHNIAAYDRQCGRDHTGNNPDPIEKYNDLILNYWPDLKQNEGFQQEGYLDTNGNITIGLGRMINNEDDFVALPLEMNGRPATIAEKQAEWARLSDFKGRGLYGKEYEFWKFQQKDKSKKLLLPETTMVDMTMKHLEWDLRELERKFPEFETYPRPLQMVLLDMQYNMGNNFNDEKWPKFYDGVRNKDINKMVNEVNRSQVAPGRNDWARRSLKEIPVVDGWYFKN